jgi:hypothetical protein
MNASKISELENAEFGDLRLTNRLAKMGAAVVKRPGVSLPQAMVTPSGLEAAYRFLRHKSVCPEKILAPHIAATAKRIAEAGTAYCISDTTEFRFEGENREGLGPLQNGRGFLGHISLAVAADGTRLPLGVLNLDLIVRPKMPKKRRGTTKSRNAMDSESLKWGAGVLASEEALPKPGALIHLMDREADIYALLVFLVARDSRFIIRIGQNRLINHDDEILKLFDVLTPNRELKMSREVELSRRTVQTKQHPKRGRRTAELSIQARSLEIRRPSTCAKSMPESMRLNFVHVFESNPPDGEKAIDWKLVTSEPVETQADVEAAVDGYRTRWVIEEYNKALKTGCAVEKSQLEAAPSLLNYVAMMVPIATQLLALKTLAESDRKAPAAKILTDTQIDVLRAISKIELPKSPTAEQALLAIARLGGHLKNNGAPGWLILHRGMQDLLRYTDGWIAAKNAEKM